MTPVQSHVARPLVEGLRTPTVVHDHRLLDLVPLRAHARSTRQHEAHLLDARRGDHPLEPRLPDPGPPEPDPVRIAPSDRASAMTIAEGEGVLSSRDGPCGKSEKASDPGCPARGRAPRREAPSRRRPTRRTSPRTGRGTSVCPPLHLRQPRPAGGDARAVEVGARPAAGSSASVLPRWFALRSTADSLSVLPTLARGDDNPCDRLQIVRLADELRDHERGCRSVIAYERHRAASRLAVELERAVRPALGARDAADCVGHDAAIPGGSVAQPSSARPGWE